MNFSEPTSTPPSGIIKGLPVLNAAATLLVSVLFLLSSCQGNKGPYSKEVLVIGHAGSGFFSPFNPYNPLPPNSMASIVQAMEEDGADGVEVDVHVSKDGVPILYHDTSLETMSEGEGMIEQLPASEVVGLRYKGGILYDLFHSEKLISLEDMLQRFQQYPELPYLHVDLRNHDASRNSFYAESLLKMLRKYNYPNEKLTFISPDIALLQAIRETEPEATLLVDAGDNLEIAMQDALANKLHGMAANGKKVSQEQVQRARKQGLQVVLFGGKSGSSIAKMLEMAPDAIEVNNVKRMRALLDQNQEAE